jgi:hypothetical protein
MVTNTNATGTLSTTAAAMETIHMKTAIAKDAQDAAAKRGPWRDAKLS